VRAALECRADRGYCCTRYVKASVSSGVKSAKSARARTTSAATTAEVPRNSLRVGMASSAADYDAA
jgi:hypothetical protein